MIQTKIALVTGGSRGLGRDMAISIAGKGYDVILTYHSNKEQAEETIRHIEKLGQRAVALQFDLNEVSRINVFVDNVSQVLRTSWNTDKLDFLVNNAGIGVTIPFGQVNETVFDEFMNIHFKGVYFLTQRIVHIMNDGGRVINISSGTTRFSVPGYSVYASMKGAVEVFTKYLAKELGTKGITSNVVAPGPIETDFNDAAIRNNPQMKTMLSSLSPLNRVGNADDIGSVVAFLCSDEAKWINGQRIEVSGGINV
jgi:NAD(P)-dependent dehydrogenase (short-subunit alcohol dehydrogenase family)